MPSLQNKKHEKIAQELAFGGHHSQGAAYLAAGFGKSKEGAETQICVILKKHKEIRGRVNELLGEVADRAVVTTASLVDELEQARALAISLDQPSAAVAATMGKARITGNVIERKEIGQPGEFDGLTPDELRDRLRREAEELGQGAVAAALAGGNGAAGRKPH